MYYCLVQSLFRHLLRLVPLVLLLSAASVSWAQGSPYRPLAIGDQWTYSINAGRTEPQCTGVDFVETSYEHSEVLRDTTDQGEPARVIGVTTTDVYGEVVGYEERVAWLRFPRDEPWEVSSSTVVIGATTYAVASVAEYGYSSTGSGGAFNSVLRRYAEGVGLVESSQRSSAGQAYTAPCEWREVALVHAVVEGTYYGAPPVYADPPVEAETPEEPEAPEEPEPTVAVLRAYPTPASGPLTIEVSRVANVEVFDVRGRRVARGRAWPGVPLRLDVSTWPAGLYVARASGEDGTASATVVVAR